MALIPLNPGVQPLGIFDMKNTQAAGLLGGEVMTFGTASRTNSASENAAADVTGDGYGTNRTVAQLATASVDFVALCDEGTSPGYFTMLGSVIGGNTGMTLSGSVLGPNTTAGSGKVTLWDKPGLYEVTLDAVAASFQAGAGLNGLTPGAVIGHTNVGKLSHSIENGAVAATGCAIFVEFAGPSGLVTTPAWIVGGTNTVDRVKVAFLGGVKKTVPVTCV
jgi:hypothetical protein